MARGGDPDREGVDAGRVFRQHLGSKIGDLQIAADEGDESGGAKDDAQDACQGEIRLVVHRVLDIE